MLLVRILFVILEFAEVHQICKKNPSHNFFCNLPQEFFGKVRVRGDLTKKKNPDIFWRPSHLRMLFVICLGWPEITKKILTKSILSKKNGCDGLAPPLHAGVAPLPSLFPPPSLPS